MDPLIMSAARALAAGDPLGALNRVALRDDAPALALRGIAMARLGDLVRAKVLLRNAASGNVPSHSGFAALTLTPAVSMRREGDKPSMDERQRAGLHQLRSFCPSRP